MESDKSKHLSGSSNHSNNNSASSYPTASRPVSVFDLNPFLKKDRTPGSSAHSSVRSGSKHSSIVEGSSSGDDDKNKANKPIKTEIKLALIGCKGVGKSSIISN